MKVLHLVHHSLPYQDGYSLRTGYIIKHQASFGYQPVVVTLPGIQVRMMGGSNSALRSIEHIDGIPHYYGIGERSFPLKVAKRLLRIGLSPKLVRAIRGKARDLYYGQGAWQSSILSRWLGFSPSKVADSYYDGIVKQHQPLSLLHAHTPFLNASYARILSQRYNIPFVYEVRGLWEDTYVASGEWSNEDEIYLARRRAEMKAIQEADAVVTISDALRNELINRGVRESKLFVVPNGVDSEVFKPLPRDPGLTAAYALEGKVVLGYIGSLRKLEGLDLLLLAMPDILEKDRRAVCLIAGDGPDYERLRELAHRRAIERQVIFTGRIPHDKIRQYYSLLDIFVVPRTDTRVNQMVTPLKPLEAMAMGKAILVSDVGGLVELVRHGDTGFVFRAGDRDDLIEKAVQLLQREELRQGLGIQARQWVVEERDWRNLVKRYDTIYCDLGAHN